MVRLVPLLLLALGLGAAHLGIGGPIKLHKDRPVFWPFGLGVRTKFGAAMVLFVAVALLFLAYSSQKRASVIQILERETGVLLEEHENLAMQLNQAKNSIESYRQQIQTLSQEKEDCQKMASSQELQLANKNDVAGELQVSLGMRQREIAALPGNLDKMKEEIALLQQEHEKLSQSHDRNQRMIL